MSGQRGGSQAGSGSGAVPDDLTVGDDLTVSQGPLVVGNGSGSVEIQMLKSDGGTATLGCYVGGVLRGSFVIDANENTVIQPPAAGSAATGATTAIRGGLPGGGHGIGGSLNLQGANAAATDATVFAGGNINLTPGTAINSGSEGMIRLNGAFGFITIISPSVLASGSTDNYNPTGMGTCTALRVTTNADGTSALSGIVPTAGGSSGNGGRLVLICNVGAFNLTLTHDATSATTNRFLCPNSANLVIPPNGSRWLWYDTTSTRWRVEGAVA